MCGILVSTDQKSDLQKFEEGLSALKKRGPDQSAVVQVPDGIIGLERLAIMELSKQGMQPFWLNDKACVCNGEIYGFRKLKKELEKDYEFISDSDCEIILPLYEKYGLKMFEMLDAEFAMVIYDQMKHEWLAARDPIGIRPLFYGKNSVMMILRQSVTKSMII